MNRYKISKEDMGKSFEAFFHCKFIEYNEKIIIPGELF